MKWSFRLGTLFGIPVYLHFTFLLLLGFVGLMQTARGGLFAGLAGVVWVASIFGCVVLHEFGHALAARRFGIPTRDVTLLPIGGLTRLERMPDKPRQELVVALAGPAVNVAIAAAAGFLLLLTGAAMGGADPTGGSFLGRLVFINVVLAAFNMLPAFPMDGGRVLRALLAERMSYVRATELAATIGRGMAVLFGIAGLFGSPMLIFIAIFVWFGAGQEAALARQRHAWGASSPGSGWSGTAAPSTYELYPDGVWRPSAPSAAGETGNRRRYYRVGSWIVRLD